MKKGLLSLVALLVMTTMTNAAPQFGLIGDDTGFGATVVDEVYNAAVTYTSPSEDVSAITIAGNYKIHLDSVTALTTGVAYTAGDVDGDAVNYTVLNLGIERSLSSKILLNAAIEVYETCDSDLDSFDGETALFGDTNIGITYLF